MQFTRHAFANRFFTLAVAAGILMATSSLHGQAGSGKKGSGTKDSGTTQGSGTKAGSGTRHPAMLDPSKATEKAPDSFEVKFATTKGDFIVEAKREWSPNGVDRFYNMVKIGYFQDIVIFRAIPGFMWQFGIHGDPAVNAKWAESKIKDDPAKAGISNQMGFLTFAKTGMPNSRSVQFFVNLGNNQSLDSQKFTPFARVTKGLDVIKKINTEYGENRPEVQSNFQAKGNSYIDSVYPNLDRIKSITLMPNAATANE